MRLVCLSDTHMKHDQVTVPDGDVLIHAGDLATFGGVAQIEQAAGWLRSLPHETKIVIAGNHDRVLQSYPKHAESLLEGLTYLFDSSVQVGEFLFYGSPWQPEFQSWAFNLPRGEKLREKWDLIPDETDVLITHGPPYGFGDRTYMIGEHQGCAELLEAVGRVQPRLHIFGHIHEGYGMYNYGETLMINASVANHRYQIVNEPVVIDL